MLDARVPRARLWAGIAVLVAAGCGGTEAPAQGDGGGGGSDSSPGNAGAGGAGGNGAGTTVGAVTLSADPGTAWAEVDGGRLEYQASGGVAYECTVDADRVSINFQTVDGRDLLVRGARQDSGWTLTLTFKPGGGDEIQYGARTPGGGGSFGVGDGAVSYEGPVERIEDFDVTNATEVPARVAINCAPAGGAGAGDPAATIGGQSFEFALSGAQSVECEVAPSAVSVRINRLAIDGTQLEIDARQDGGQWIGAVAVYTDAGTFTSPVPPDGAGLAIDGSTVEYRGSFTSPDGSTVDGTAAATCP